MPAHHVPRELSPALRLTLSCSLAVPHPKDPSMQWPGATLDIDGCPSATVAGRGCGVVGRPSPLRLCRRVSGSSAPCCLWRLPAGCWIKYSVASSLSSHSKSAAVGGMLAVGLAGAAHFGWAA